MQKVQKHYQREPLETVYFYTFHKCASSLFSRYILKSVEGLEHVDYATMIYNGHDTECISFSDKGKVYGPIRLSANKASPVYKKLVKPVSSTDFIKDKIAIFLIRDPRDIIVSSYYSFGYSHEISKAEAVKDLQVKRRAEIQQASIDDYATSVAIDIQSNFKRLARLSNACTRSVTLKFEDMLQNWEGFAISLTNHIDIKPSALERIYLQTRPRGSVYRDSHRRSGKAGQFRQELKPGTIRYLNEVFDDALVKFDYSEL